MTAKVLDQTQQHKYAHEQIVQVEVEPGVLVPGKVLAILPTRCATHNSLMYGCECGGAQWNTCEEIMQPLTDKQKRKMN